MALQTKPDKELNPEQKHYDDTFGSGYSSSGADQAEAFANDPANSTAQSLDDAEAQAAKGSRATDDIREQEDKGTWSDKTSGNLNPNLNQPKLQKALKFAKKRGGVLGLIGIFGVSGGLIASFLAPASVLVNLIENISQSNDSSSTAMERRFMKVFGNMTSSDPICSTPTSRTIKCTMGRISNSAISKLERRGDVKANFDEGVTNTGKKTGYPSKNPSSYTFKVDGNEITKPANEVRQFLVDNPKVASKVLGRSGAFNMRIQAWAGKYISEKFFKRYSLERKGGLADGTHKSGLSTQERLAATYEKLEKKIPGADKLGNYTERLSAKVSSQLEVSKKGGVGYVVSVGGCLALKAPALAAGTVAAVQVAQVMPAFNEVVASPGGKTKAAGYGIPDSLTAEDADAIGTLITEKTVPKDGGKAGSVLDSPILQSTMGVNTNKAPLSESFTPGLSILLATKGIRDLQKTTEPACNTIMSPAAMWTAFAVDSAVTVAASATVIGGIVKVAGSALITTLAVEAVKAVVTSDVVTGAITAAVQNDQIPKAKGKDLGDVLGIGGAAFYSAGGMARGLPTLKQGQLSEFVAMQQENEDFQRDMDVATLSPFDVSSRYTFLGNIAYNTQMAVIGSGSYGNLAGTLSSVARLPLSILSPSTNAATTNKANACSYAADFGLNLANNGVDVASSEQPAIGPSGLPCVGLTQTQGNMDTNEAIDLLTNEGWINGSATVRENASIDDLVKSGVIVADTPLSDYLATCTDASTGDYLFNGASCSVGNGSKNTAEYTSSTGCFTDAKGKEVCFDADTNGGSGSDGVKNPRSLEAMSVFLLDFQIRQSVNGEDEGNGDGKNASTGTGAVSLPVDPGYGLSDGWIPRSCAGCASFHVAQDFFGGNQVVKSATDGSVIDADKSGSSNNVVRIQAPNGVITEYWHMEGANILVNAGDTVTAGQQIGTMGCVGVCFGTHLHFMVDVSNATDEQVKAITTRPKDGKTYGKPDEWFALYGIAM